MIKKENIEIEGSNQRPILTDIYYDGTIKTKKPLVIFCHGYKGFKDWGIFSKMPVYFTDAACFFVKINFSHNGGTAKQPIDFPDLEAFGHNNFSKELDDLGLVLDYLMGHEDYTDEIDKDQVVLIGHSRGGGIVTLKTAEDIRIKKTITWAAVSDFKSRFPTGEGLAFWRKNGVAYIENARTKQQMPHYYQFYEDFIKNENRLDILRNARNIKSPFLIVHGTKDESVKIEEAYTLIEAIPHAQQFVLEGADHTFNGKHPWDEAHLPDSFIKVLEQTISFIKN